jgi:hypothetical protein
MLSSPKTRPPVGSAEESDEDGEVLTSVFAMIAPGSADRKEVIAYLISKISAMSDVATVAITIIRAD